ncbi:MAG: tRNA (adenosine(37)-N6)-threonylcarbamoyltransferase complex dimerization subunit type 1 TsaB [Acholeplasmatales bacterium]|nr:tRNA (adenosine(37)-N6)-threonylcarbamoyltransferase complex dimerization subunit type 1 TsaB [Acholeplasmatales bacterium]
MYSLILDSATKNLYICLCKDKKVLEEIYIKGQNDHSKNIVSKLDLILKNHNITSNDLDEIIVGYGPGSYTGVRMAVTVGKMMAVFLNKPLYTISTLKLISSNMDGKVLAMIDARRGNSFSSIIDMKTNTCILKEGMYPNEELLSKEHDNVVSGEDFKVNPLYVLENKEKVEVPTLLEPNYLRETEAERNLHD